VRAASTTEAPPAAAGAAAAAAFAAPYLAALAAEPTPNPALKDAGPPPARFQPGKGTLAAVGAAAFAPVARLGSGALAYGYKVERGDASLPENKGRYAVLPGAYETSLVSSLPRPSQPLVLFEFQSCPFCAKVREAVSFLDLDVLFFPCPKGGTVFRPEAQRLGGKQQFPLLLDVNGPGGEPVLMYESNDIINYLFKNYGPGVDAIPGPLKAGTLATVSAGLALLPRGGAGGRAAERKGERPAKPLVLWAYEASPFVRIVRERLGELELPHLQVTCARGSADKRQRLYDARNGAFQVPYLEDPDKGVYLFESAAILKYLDETYGAGASA
jgi:glutathione S-transferase